MSFIRSSIEGSSSSELATGELFFCVFAGIVTKKCKDTFETRTQKLSKPECKHHRRVSCVFTYQLSAYRKYRQLPQRERVCALSAVVWPIYHIFT